MKGQEVKQFAEGHKQAACKWYSRSSEYSMSDSQTHSTVNIPEIFTEHILTPTTILDTRYTVVIKTDLVPRRAYCFARRDILNK